MDPRGHYGRDVTNPLRFLRDALGARRFEERTPLSQPAAARTLGVSRRQWSRYEADPGGVRFPIRLAVVAAYALLIDGYRPPPTLRRWLFPTEASEWPEASAAYRWQKERGK